MPDILSLEVTTRCNLKCVNCFAHADGSPWGDFPADRALTLLREGAALGFKRLSLTGGEPFLWPPVLEVLSEARALGYEFILVNTNGHLLDGRLCAALGALGPAVELSVTLNGGEDLHDGVRGAGSWDKARKGIAEALAHGVKIQVFTVVGKPLVDRLPAFVDTVYRDFPGVDGVHLIQLRGVDDGYYQVEGLKLDPEDYLAVVKMAGYLNLAGRPVYFLENSLSAIVAQRLGLRWVPPSPEITRPGKIVVLQDGSAALNHSATRRVGAYEPGTLGDLLGSDQYRTATGEDTLTCGPCPYRPCCRAGGKVRPSSRFHNTGDLTKPYCRKVLELLE